MRRYKIIVQPEAHAEVIEIFDDLQMVKDGLGERFLDELDNCFALLRQYPYGFQIRWKHYRYGYIKRFDYRVVYVVDGDAVYIYQVRHTARKVSPEFGP